MRNDDPGRQQGAVQSVKPFKGSRILRHAAVVLDDLIGWHNLEQRAIARSLRFFPGPAEDLIQAVAHAFAHGLKVLVPSWCEFFQGGQACCGRQWIAAVGSTGDHPLAAAGRIQQRKNVGPAPNCTNRQAPTNNFAKRGQIWFAAISALRSCLAKTKGDDFVEDQHNAVFARDLVQKLEKARCWQRHSRAVRQGFKKQCADRVPVLGQQLFDAALIIERHDQHFFADRMCQPTRARYALRCLSVTPVGRSRRKAHLNIVVIAVVSALEFRDPGAPGKGSRQLDRHHDGFSARTAKVDLFDRGHPIDKQAGERDLGLRGLRETDTALDLIDDRCIDLRIRMTMDQCGHVAQAVNALVTIHIGQPAALARMCIDRPGLEQIVQARSRARDEFSGLRVHPDRDRIVVQVAIGAHSGEGI